MLNKLIKEADSYERGEMLRSDSEVEIDIIDGEVWVCDYSESRGDSFPVVKVCDEGDIEAEDIIRVCNEHHWSYCM